MYLALSLFIKTYLVICYYRELVISLTMWYLFSCFFLNRFVIKSTYTYRYLVPTKLKWPIVLLTTSRTVYFSFIFIFSYFYTQTLLFKLLERRFCHFLYSFQKNYLPAPYISFIDVDCR